LAVFAYRKGTSERKRKETEKRQRRRQRKGEMSEGKEESRGARGYGSPAKNPHRAVQYFYSEISSKM
jgi:hypothetical protein